MAIAKIQVVRPAEKTVKLATGPTLEAHALLAARVAALEALISGGVLTTPLEVRTELRVKHASNASHAILADDGTLGYHAVGETNPRELAFPPDVMENQSKLIATRDWVLEQLA